MNQCARCRSETSNIQNREYAYCDDCKELFEYIKENEVYLMQRRPRAATNLPDAYYEVTDNIGDRHEQVMTQVEGLATALDYMERHDCRGLFYYQESGSRWLIHEYLDTHPNIASDVKDERKGIITGLFSSIFG